MGYQFDLAMAQSDAIAFFEMGKIILLNGNPVNAIVSPSGKSSQRLDGPGGISRVAALRADVAYSDLVASANGSSYVGLPVQDGTDAGAERYVVEAYSVNGVTVTLYCGLSAGTGSQF